MLSSVETYCFIPPIHNAVFSRGYCFIPPTRNAFSVETYCFIPSIHNAVFSTDLLLHSAHPQCCLQ